jgi:hypothetical protein
VASVSEDLSVEVVCRGARSPVVSASGNCDPLLGFLALLDSVPESEGRPFLDFAASNHVVEVPLRPRGSAS